MRRRSPALPIAATSAGVNSAGIESVEKPMPIARRGHDSSCRPMPASDAQ